MTSKFDVMAEVLGKTEGSFSDDPGAKEWVEAAVSGVRHREMGAFASLGYWTYLELLVSRSDVPECLRAVREFHEGTLERNNVTYHSNMGCVSIGANQWIITSIIFLEGWDPKAMGVMRELWKDGLDMGVSRGWLPDANQGHASVAMARHWSPAMANFMRNVKRALDPNNIMNPGVWDL